MNGSDDPGARAKAEPQADHEPTLFEWAGGSPALLRMTRIFYGKYVPGTRCSRRSSRRWHPTIRSVWRRGWARSSEARVRTASASAVTTAWSRGTSERRSAKSSVPAGSICSASPRTTRSFRLIPNGARPSSPTSSGAPGSRSRTRSQAPIRRPTCRCPAGRGSATPLPARESRRSPSRQHSRKKPTSPDPTSRSASRSTSSRSSVRETAARCASRSTSGHTRTWRHTPRRPRSPAGGDDAVRRSVAQRPSRGLQRWLDSGNAA